MRASPLSLSGHLQGNSLSCSLSCIETLLVLLTTSLFRVEAANRSAYGLCIDKHIHTVSSWFQTGFKLQIGHWDLIFVELCYVQFFIPVQKFSWKSTKIFLGGCAPQKFIDGNFQIATWDCSNMTWHRGKESADSANVTRAFSACARTWLSVDSYSCWHSNSNCDSCCRKRWYVWLALQLWYLKPGILICYYVQ